MNDKAIRLALNALYETLTEEQKTELAARLFFDVDKHDKPGTEEKEAIEALRGW